MEEENFPDVMPDSSCITRRWYWKEDTGTLEQISGFGGFHDKGVISGKNKKSKVNHGVTAVHFQEDTNFRSRVSPTDAAVNGKSTKTASFYGSQSRASTSPRASSKIIDKSYIQLSDVKRAAYDKTSEEFEISKRFQEYLCTEQMDHFLTSCLLYFDAHFLKRELEQKPRPMAAEPSTEELMEMSIATEKEMTLRKILAKSYSIIILCLGIENLHHMSGGRERSSATETDRTAYEILYLFVSNVIWVTFKRQHLIEINSELGMLFRSDTFNPAVTQIKETEFILASDLAKQDINHKLKLSTKKSYQKVPRPPITSIINQRSPVLTTLLPTPRDISPWLLDRKKPIALKQSSRQPSEVDLDIESLSIDPSLVKVGIIGESMLGFNPLTLAPFGDDQEESDDDNDDENTCQTGESRTQTQERNRDTNSPSVIMSSHSERDLL